KAQEETVEIGYGDTLYFSHCEGNSYQYIDLYIKTRFEKGIISLDTLFEWEFYNEFFNHGDFDVSRMPCEYAGRYGIIKHMMRIEDDNNEPQNVIILMIEDGISVAYLIEDALLEEEVTLYPVM